MVKIELHHRGCTFVTIFYMKDCAFFKFAPEKSGAGARKMAGVAGFEPANAGTKNRCLTTWRHPNSHATLAGERPYNVEKLLGNRLIAQFIRSTQP